MHHRAILAALLFLTPALAYAESVRIGMPEWCPYTCEDKANPGLMVEITRDILKAHGIDAEFEIYDNWNRLLYDGRKGRVDAVLAVAPTEAPALLFPKNPMVDVLISFFVRADSNWKYTSNADFNGRLLLGFDNLDYGTPVQPYVDKYKNDRTRIELATGETEEVFMNKLPAHHGDIYLEDKNVGLYMIKHEKLEGLVKMAPRSDVPHTVPLSIGFAPNYPHAAAYAAIISAGVEEMKANGTYQTLLEHYIE